MNKMSLGDRMKLNYEHRSRICLTRRIPVILRVDGKAFHTLTRKYCEKPFDEKFNAAMFKTAGKLVKNIQGAKCAYVQSDEISILLTDFDKLNTDAWFNYNIQKMASVSASMATLKFTLEFKHIGYFDSRSFNVPKEDVCNYFVWRQQDWERNSLQMLSSKYYSHKELHGKNKQAKHEMLHKKGVNWATDLDDKWKNGIFIAKVDGAWKVAKNCPQFKDEVGRKIINKLLTQEE